MRSIDIHVRVVFTSLYEHTQQLSPLWKTITLYKWWLANILSTHFHAHSRSHLCYRDHVETIAICYCILPTLYARHTPISHRQIW